MAQAAPQTISKEIIRQINGYLADGKVLDANDFVIRSLKAETKKLMQVDACQAHIALAGIANLCNDLETVKYHIKVANTLPTTSKTLLATNSTTALANIFLISMANEYFKNSIEPENGNITEIIDAGISALSFQQLNIYLQKAKLMNLNINDDFALTERAATVLQKFHITDEIVAAYADIFCSVLSENNYLLGSQRPSIDVGDHSTGWMPETVFITFKVKTDAKSAAQLYKEGTKRLINAFGPIPYALHFSIEAL